MVFIVFGVICRNQELCVSFLSNLTPQKYMCIYICIYVYIYIYVSLYIRIYVYILLCELHSRVVCYPKIKLIPRALVFLNILCCAQYDKYIYIYVYIYIYTILIIHIIFSRK